MNKRKISRRTLLGGAATAAVMLFKSSYGKMIQTAIPESLYTDDPTKTVGPPPGAVGTRSPFEHPVKKASDTSSRTPLQDLYGTITPLIFIMSATTPAYR